MQFAVKKSENWQVNIIFFVEKFKSILGKSVKKGFFKRIIHQIFKQPRFSKL